MPASRDRFLAAAVEEVVEGGYEATSVTAIASRTGATPTEFRSHFNGKSDCCRCALEEICERFDLQLLPVYLTIHPWRRRIRLAAYAAARFCGEHKMEIRFAIDEWRRGGRSPKAEASLCLHLEEVDRGRAEAAESSRIPLSAAELAVGAFLEVVVRADAEGRLMNLNEEIPALLYRATRTYLGGEAAEEELRLTEPYWKAGADRKGRG